MSNSVEIIQHMDLPVILRDIDFFSLTSDDEKIRYLITLGLVAKEFPGKIFFSFYEISKFFGVGEEFIRRRAKSGIILVDYFGDKPRVHICELVKISMKGIK